MKNFSDLPIYSIVIGLVLNIALSLYAKTAFNVLMIRSIIVIILFGVMGYVTAEVLKSASNNLQKNKKAAKTEVAKEVTTTSTFDIKAKAEDDEELLRAMSQPEDAFNELEKMSDSNDEDFVEIKPEDFKTFMNQE